METLQLRLSLAGIDTPEEKLRELQNWLQDAGVFVRLEIEPPAEGEMGGKVTALRIILAISLASEFGHLPPAVVEGLRQIHTWQQQQQQVIKPVIESTSDEKFDKKIREKIQREQWHIEVREPEPPPLSIGKAQVVAPPKPPTGKNNGEQW